MNLIDILQALPPQVYLRRGELVVQFTNPADLIIRVAEVSAAFLELERKSSDRASELRPERAQRRISRTGPAGADGQLTLGGDLADAGKTEPAFTNA